MSFLSIFELVALAGFAAYLQTLIGFAMGLAIMGGAALTGFLAIPDAAVLVSVLTLFNAVQIFSGNRDNIAWREFLLLVIPGLAALPLGFWLLTLASEASIQVVKIFIGAIIVLASLQLILRPSPLPKISSASSFAIFGLLGGILGGLLSTSGPPIIFQMYRQPLPQDVVRKTLLLVFATNGALRLFVVTASGHFPDESAWWALIALPAVSLCTYLAHRFPPPISKMALRRLAFVLFAATGLVLALAGIAGQIMQE